jgi:aspartyl-tRNA(Asn)/glutamyl-tRNA(Gln) amidotransferase subunit A
VEVVDAVLSRIARLNPSLNCYLTVLGDQARRQAARAAREIAGGNYRGPLHGIPISLKDNIWTAGVRTTAGSKILAEFVPAEDAEVTTRLAHAGAILLGKTNLHEFAYGVTTNNPHYGPARNPYDLARIPGGSSGGSAAAIAAGMCCASIGTDTGGSIRIPAALCGIVGLKPTRGRVSCHGVVPLARSLDHVGPLARTVRDAAILLGVMAGFDPRDPASVAAPVPDYVREMKRPLKRARVGWPRDFFFERVEPPVLRAIEAARDVLESLGARFVEVSLPHVAASLVPTTRIALVEATQYHRAAGYFPARAAEYGEDVRSRLETGSRITAADYLDALDVRSLMLADFEDAFKHVDAILAPAAPVEAPRIGEETISVAGESEDVRNALVRLNRPGNLTGLPAVSIPCGTGELGLPIGLQLIGRPWDEAGILGLALAYERATAGQRRRPALAGIAEKGL